MKIVADENIPFVREYFGGAGELVLKPGRYLTREDMATADILLVRSVTRVNRELLEGTPVKFVGSAATGVDHIDTNWLDQAGIQWYAAKGCNTVAVVEYIIAVVAQLKKMAVFPARRCRAAVIGMGRIGTQVAEKLTLLGFDVVYCDPLRARAEPNFMATALQDLADLDFITLHVPLTEHGDFPTRHLINKAFLLRQQKGCVLVNTSRGAVIDFSDLSEYGEHLYWCLDVWEYEPLVSFHILDLATIATPHIAGYSLQSKQRGIEMVYQAACEQKMIAATELPLIPSPQKTLSFENQMVDWCDVVLGVFDPEKSTQEMKLKLVENGSGAMFDAMRKDFKARYEFAFVNVTDCALGEEDRGLLEALGLNIKATPL